LFMKDEVFVDTSGFYALLVKADDCHKAAADIISGMRRAGRVCLTTDYILDETVTLLKARGKGHLLSHLLDAVLNSTVCRVVWTDRPGFEKAVQMILSHQDKGWSFTDCVSFCVMKENKIKKALTKDAHFRQAGFEPLLGGGG